jgi:hypothetical protein
MEINDEHVEFAIVQRFCEMLQEPHPRYEVSFIYALFVAILCWSTQRLRTDTKKDYSPEARAAAKVWADFEREPIFRAPWSIAIVDDTLSSGEKLSGHSFASSDFHDHTADRLVKNLRDAAAHGDARKVEPYHTGTRGKPDRALVGFTFKCEEGYRQNRQWIVTWTGEITLRADDMARVAGEVAKRFCSAMEETSRYSYLKEDATKGVKEAA